MNSNSFRPARFAGLVLSAALLPVLIGCVSDSDRRSGRGHSPSRYVRTEIQLEDDYVYYPGYEVYYSSSRRSFVYRDGRNWVARSAPPRVGIDIVLSSPSVRVEFRDAPAHHHADIVKRYPRHWRPSDQRDEPRPEDRKAEDRDRKDGRNNGRDDDKRHN